MVRLVLCTRTWARHEVKKFTPLTLRPHIGHMTSMMKVIGWHRLHSVERGVSGD